ncbi:glycosyltransferase [Olleya sp. R77988]|uniref:glycosyltransferase n=1 Tax=Olleya sp. R77988 TaxID=3093875 RepID=UPI0037C54C6D
MSYFSVIIPLFNKEKYILKTLESVLNQSCQDFEIIIIDDGSTDNSVSIIKAINDDRIQITTQNNQGVSVARNNAISQSKGKYLALLDADDLWHNNHLESFKKTISLFPEAGLFCNNYQIKRQGGLLTPTNLILEHQNQPLIVEDYFLVSQTNSLAWTSSVCFTKSVFEKIGQFDTKLITGQDIDLWIRFALNHSIAFNPEVTMIYNNFDDGSLSKSKLNLNRYYLINKYKKEEKGNTSLKMYLDINRYALAIRCHLNSEKDLYKKLKKEINYSNLNNKQKLLIKLPKWVLRLIKKFQLFLINKNIYLSAFK